MATAIGCGEWSAYLTGRGGSPLRAELAWTRISFSRTLNTGSNGSVSIPSSWTSGTTCCQALQEGEPWRDELAFYRDTDADAKFAGPLVSLSSSLEGGTASANDLFAWMEQRFVGDFHFDGDVADIFRAVFDQVYALDTSPNIDITTRQTGVTAIRDFKEVEFHRAADALRELARTGLDFTTVGRRILAGGKEVFLSTTPLLLHDEGVLSAEMTKEGQNLATDVAVFGSTGKAGSSPVNGRATTGDELYGLIQRSFTELLIKDNPSADANALARLEAMQPAPLRLRVRLSDQAAFGFDDLIAGRRVDVRLSEAAGCGRIDQVMRLQQVDVEASVSESGSEENIDLSLIPLGVGDSDA